MEAMETHMEEPGNEPEPVAIPRRGLRPRSAKKAVAKPTASEEVEASASRSEAAAELIVSEQVEASAPPSEGWTNEHVKMLLSGMLENMPESRSWASGQRAMRWDRVAFHPYTAEMCLKKWMEICKTIPKMRNLTELVKDAQDAFENPYKKDNCKMYKKIYQDFPKRPAPSISLFYQEKRNELQKQHPEMRGPELLVLAVRRYSMLSEEEKARYIEKNQRAREEYSKRLALHSKQYPHLKFFEQKARNSEKTRRVVKKKKVPAPQATPSNSASTIPTKAEIWSKLKRGLSCIPRPHNMFCSEQMLKAEPSHVKAPRRFGMISATWRNLPKEQKEIYQQRHDTLRKECIRELQKCFNTLSATEQKKFLKKNPRKQCFFEYCPEGPSGERYTLLDDKKESSERRYTLFDQNEERSKGRPRKRTSASSSSSMSAVSAVTEVMLPEPKSPPTSRTGHLLFCSEQMKALKPELGHLNPRKRLSLISAKWRTLPKNEKLIYQQRADERKREYLRELQNWSNNLSATEKAVLWQQNPKKRSLLEKLEEKSRKRTSDSEDDDIQTDTTSSEDDDPHECEDENVNDEDAPLEDRTSSSDDGSSSEGDQ